MLRRHLVPVLAAGALYLAACNDDGRTLAPAPTVPASPLTTGPASSELPGSGAEGPDVGQQFSLSSPDFADGDVLDPTFTCDGLNVSPELQITGVPVVAAELAIAVIDVDGGGGVRWIISGLAPVTTTIERGVTPPGAVTARTSTGVIGWDGPCPAATDPLHTYQFTVYALPEPIGLSEGIEGTEALRLLESAAVERHTIVAFYGAAEG